MVIKWDEMVFVKKGAQQVAFISEKTLFHIFKHFRTSYQTTPRSYTHTKHVFDNLDINVICFPCYPSIDYGIFSIVN